MAMSSCNGDDEEGVATCSRPVFPSAVVKSVRQQMESFQPGQPVPDRMQLSESMKTSNLKDTTVSSDSLVFSVLSWSW